MSNEEMAEFRYQETMDAICDWLAGQKGKGSAAEAMGVGKAFLHHASFAIALSLPGSDVSDAERLREKLFEVVVQFVEENPP